ncbi:MAG: hypothetical protein ACI4DK_03600 [Lachnospiraceae bacterium]
MENQKIDKKNLALVAVYLLVGACYIAIAVVVGLYVTELNVSATEILEELPTDDDFDVVTVPEPIDYTQSISDMNDNIVILQEQLSEVKETLSALSDSVSQNDMIDYTEQIQEVSEKLTQIENQLTVSENTVSENSLLNTPLEDLTADQQLNVFIIVLLCVAVAGVVLAYFL